MRRRLGVARARRAQAAPPALVRLGRVVARVEPARRWADARAPGRDARDAILGRCCAVAALGMLASRSAVHGTRVFAALPLGAWVGWRVGARMQERTDAARAAEVCKALPYALDRMTTCVLSGMSVERALRVVVPGTEGPLGEAFARGLAALDVGMTRAHAYSVIADSAGVPEVGALTGALARAERFGTSVSAVLAAQAREMRSRARAAAEAEAQAVPLKLVFPLVFCFLPAFVLLTVAPIALSAVRTLGGI